jgi:uncharacterized protein
MLIHGYTGAIDIVDSNIVNALNAENISSVLSEDEISLLSQRGYLTNKTVEEEQSYVAHFADVLHRMNSKLYKNFGFVITYDCNFRCPYCFENIISKHGTAWTKRTITKELVDKAYDAMLKIEAHRELHTNEILLYGGEPFLRENYDIVKYIIKKGYSLGYKFKAITNGYDLDFYEDLLSPEYFTFIQISMDGFRDNHNKRKFHYKEGASFEKVIKNIGLSLNHKIKTQIRLNFDKVNILDKNILYNYFVKLGYDKCDYFLPYAAMVESREKPRFSDKERFLSSEEFTTELKEEKCIVNPITQKMIKAFELYFKNKTPIKLSPVACTAQYGSHFFDPYGDIYPCLEIVGRKEYSLGTYNEINITWNSAKNDWFSRHVGNDESCKKCKFALICGGKCVAKRISKLEQSCTQFFDSFYNAANSVYSKMIYTAKK